MATGLFLWIFTYWLLCEALQLPRFVKIPGPVTIFTEWFSRNPHQGISIFTPEYYQHIYVSCRRIFIAFFIATSVGVPLGLFMGWSRTFREYTFPILETLRPIPILAWVPLAILMFSGYEARVAWFSLVAAEMVSGDYGLGYLILSSYVNSVTVPMVIGMLTLGLVGWVTSAIVRFVGNRLMRWHARALALQGR
ncbi:MAG: ABC transporter permease [Proteobacteria bacterium]|nr:ABC transporter permease [Pseudomonadota bacterium]